MSALRRSVKNAAKSYAPCERDVREATSNDKKASPPLVRNWHQCAFARCSYDISFFFGPSFSWRGAGFQRRRAVADINRCLVCINWWCCCSSSPRSSSLCISSVDFFWVLTSIFVEKKKIDVQSHSSALSYSSNTTMLKHCGWPQPFKIKISLARTFSLFLGFFVVPTISSPNQKL